MIKMKGNVWNVSREDDDIVIPTNIGWRTNRKNVMGRGLAKDASRYYPNLPEWYGEKCLEYGKNTPVVRYGPLILFPVKPLNEFQPWLSWQAEADLDLIARSLDQLAEIESRSTGLIFVPIVGCGNGGLDPNDVIPMIECSLGHDDRFVLIDKEGMC